MRSEKMESMGERWVNAVVELVVALDVPLDADAHTKLAAAEAATERFWPDDPDVCMALRWEDVEDGEPIRARTS